MKKTNKILTELLDTFFEITGMFWQAGVVITGLILLFSFLTLQWVIDINSIQSESRLLGIVMESIGWAFYLAPVVISCIAYMFANRTYHAYCEQRDRLS